MCFVLLLLFLYFNIKSSAMDLSLDDLQSKTYDSYMFLVYNGDGLNALALYHGNEKGSLPYQKAITLEVLDEDVQKVDSFSFLRQRKTIVCEGGGENKRILYTIYLNALPYETERVYWSEKIHTRPHTWQQKVVNQAVLDSFLLLETEQYPFYLTDQGTPAGGLFYPDIHSILYYSGMQDVLPHELGHYVSYHLYIKLKIDMDESQEFVQIWQDEADKLSYAGQDSREWYAESFGILFNEDSEKVEWLKQHCPETYRYVMDGIDLFLDSITTEEITSLTVEAR